jgi:nicotinamide-nucleotide amidase
MTKNKEAVASIITIGDELLIGQVLDTNSAWIAQQLNVLGIWVKRRIAVGDNRDDILQALERENRDAALVIITGGLGPTADDITKPVLCEYFGGKMVMNESVLKHVRYLSEVVYKRPFIERNALQAEVPDVCTVLHNERGSAPGMWFEKNDTIFISLPGVPFEMKGIMEMEGLPRIAGKFTTTQIVHRTIITWGIGESFIAERIKVWEEKLPDYIKLAYLPHFGIVRLRLTGKGNDRSVLESELEQQENQLQLLVSEWLIAKGDLSLVNVIHSMLKANGQTVGTAESCTGGYIAQLLTGEPGSSSVYKGSIVGYSNEIKESLLNVPSSILQSRGAVSEETVTAMVSGALNILHTDYVIATSGIMGPDGGTASKPVGMVWIAAGSRSKILARKFQFRFDRQRNIEITAINALMLLRSVILENKPVTAS